MSFRRCFSLLSLRPQRMQIRVDANLKSLARQTSQLAAPQWSLKLYRERDELLIKDVKQAQMSFLVVVDSNKADDIAYEYANYKRLLKILPARSPNTTLSRWSAAFDPLRAATVLKAAKALAATGKSADANTLSMLLDDCRSFHDVIVDNDMLKLAVDALASTGQALAAFDLLRRHRTKPHGTQKSTSGMWLVVMQGLAAAGEVDRLKWCCRRVKTFSAQQCHLLLRDVLQKPTLPAVEITEVIVAQMLSAGLRFHEDIFRLLKESEPTHGHRMEEIASNYKAMFPVGPVLDKEAALAALKVARSKGRYEFLTLFRTICDQGFRANELTLSHLMDNISVLSELEFLETTLEVKANNVAWSKLIKNVLARRGLPEALHIYEAAKGRGIKPDSAMVHPLLRSLCNPPFEEPDEEALDKALAIFRDLQEINPMASSDKPKGHVADTAIYNTLLRAFASTSLKSKYFPAALQLLRGMETQNVRMDSMTATSVTILLIRSSRSYSEALKAYRYVQSCQPNVLDTKAYAAILNAFCSINFGDQSYPPATGYFEIVRDMERRGIPRSAEVYTVLLGRYAAVADRIRVIKDQRVREQLREAVEAVLRSTHDHLTVDASVTPDAPLYNQLMDAYNRVGSIENVLKVWSLLTSTGQHTNASVSIVLDACGFAGQYGTASTICSSLLESGFSLNLRNWNSWVECLCRLGRLPKALDVVCLEMPKNPDTYPDKSTIRVLASFGRVMGRVDEIRSRLRHHFPDDWSTFSQELRI